MSHIIKKPQCTNCKGKQFERVYSPEEPTLEYVPPREFLESENEPIAMESLNQRKCWLICQSCGAKYEIDAGMPDLETPTDGGG